MGTWSQSSICQQAQLAVLACSWRKKGLIGNTADAFLPLIVWSTQWILPSQAEHADVISNEHDVPHLEVGIQSPSSICDNQDLHPQEKEDSDGKGDLQEQKAYMQWVS